MTLLSGAAISCGLAVSSAGDNEPEVVDGVIDIERMTDGVSLEGRWGFWPSQFIYPDMRAADFHRFERFPASWTLYRPEKFSSFGYASYAVFVKGLDPAVSYALRLPSYSSAVRYFVDGKEIYQQGIPANNGKGERPFWKTAVVPLPVTGKTSFMLVLHLSNFNDIYPAGSSGIIIGSYSKMQAARSRSRIFFMIPFGAILALGAYFVAFHLFNRKDISCLWFGLFMIVIAFRLVCYDEFILLNLIPLIPGKLLYRLGFLTFPLSAIFFFCFVRIRFPGRILDALLRAAVAVSLVFSLVTVVGPLVVIKALLVPYQAFCVLAAVFIICAVMRSAILGMSGAGTFLAGFLVFFVFIVRDFLVSHRLVKGPFLAYCGAFGIIVAMSLIIVREIGHAFTRYKAVSRSLSGLNESLSRFVPVELFGFFGKTSITEVSLGDNVRRDMCVMFVNPGIGSALNMLELFNEILPRINPAIQEAGGFVDKYLDDGMMALFSDDPCRTVECALEIGRILDGINRKRIQGGMAPVEYGVGIHRGPLMIGTVGEANRMEGTVISDAVDVARRLMQFALERNFRLLVSADIAAMVSSSGFAKFSVIQQGEMRFGGKNGPIPAYEVRVK